MKASGPAPGCLGQAQGAGDDAPRSFQNDNPLAPDHRRELFIFHLYILSCPRSHAIRAFHDQHECQLTAIMPCARLYCSKSGHRALWQSTDIHVDRERRGWHENEDNSSYRGGKKHLATSWVTVIILKRAGHHPPLPGPAPDTLVQARRPS